MKPLRRAGGTGSRLHRSARVVRGVSAGRGLDRPRPDVGAARRRGAHSARLHARAFVGGAGQRLGRRVRVEVRARDESRARVRGAARHQAVHRGAVGERSRRSATQSTRDLAASDVRLTMGGEPTFVAIDDPDGDGMEHRGARADEAAARRRPLPAPARQATRRSGLVHFGQGKWYPGEPLPRWSLNCFWRRDGEPIWSDAGAPRGRARGPRRRRGRRAALPRRRGRRGSGSRLVRLRRLRGRLLLPLARAPSAGERRPVSTRGSTIRSSASASRRLFSTRARRVVGPRACRSRATAGTRWHSGPWFLRDERCYLVPGDSPIGYRLPLDSQPWVAKADYPYVYPPDPLRNVPAAAAPRRDPRAVPSRATARAARTT